MTDPVRFDVPYYPQSLDYTCGPAALMMALRHFDPAFPLTQAAEVDLWREANMVEIRGTSPQGLARAARRRGFRTRIVTNTDRLILRDRILERWPDVDAEVLDFFFRDLVRKCEAEGIPVRQREVTASDLRIALSREELPVLLTSTRVASPEHIPHWVLLTGWVEDAFYLNNPDVPGGRKQRRLPADVLEANLGFEGDRAVVYVAGREG